MFIWEGVFKNFINAKKKARGKGFLGKKWQNSQLLLFKDCIKKLNKIKLSKKYTFRYYDFLIVIKKKFRKKKINILDFGGGFGIGFFYLIQNGIKISNYTIIENKKSVKNFRKKFNQINYFSRIDYRIKYDIVNCCSVFQYLDKWKVYLKNISKINANYLFFSDLPSGNIKTFASLQNYYGDKIPYWFINFTEFNNIINKEGYVLVKKSKMVTKFPTMNNFKENRRIYYSLNLLYKKNRI